MRRTSVGRTRGLGYSLLAVTLGTVGLTGLAAAESIQWTNVAGGSWNTAANWSPADIPNEAGEEAVFPAGGGTYAVTLNVAPTLDAVTVQNSATTLNLGGRVLTLLAAGGLHNAGTVSANSSVSAIHGTVSNDSGGFFRIVPGCYLDLYLANLENAGSIQVHPTTSSSNAHLRFYQDALVGGSGEIWLQTSGATNDANLTTATGITLTQAADHTIRGAGEIPALLVNHGTVTADASGSALLLDTNGKTNHGTLRATAGGVLTISAIPVAQGTNGLLLADGGTVNLASGASITGGTVEARSGGVLRVSLTEGVLADLTLRGQIDVLSGYDCALQGSWLENDGTIAINSNLGGTNSALRVEEDVELRGLGSVVLQMGTTYTNDAVITTSAGRTLTQAAGHTIRGEGEILARLTNYGRITADGAIGPLILKTDPKENHGTLSAMAPGQLEIVADTLTQGPAGEILADGADVLLKTGTWVTGGTIRGRNGGVVSSASATARLSDLRIEGDYEVAPGCDTELSGTTITNDGTIAVNPTGSGSNAGVLVLNDLLLEGGGEIVLHTSGGDLNDAVVRTSGTALLTQGIAHTLRGEGQVLARLDNAGSVRADYPGRRLYLTTNPMENSGLLVAEKTGILRLTGCALTQDAAGVVLADSGVVELCTGASIRGGRLRSTRGGILRNTLTEVTLQDLTLEGTYEVRDGSLTVLAEGTITNQGLLELNPELDGDNDGVRAQGNVTLAGSGRLQMHTGIGADPDDAYLSSAPGAILSQAAGHMICGSGQLSAAFVNEGTIRADDPSYPLYLATNPQANAGVLEAMGGANLRIGGAQVTNTGTVQATGTGRVTLSTGELANQALVTARGHGQVIQSGGTFRNLQTLSAADSAAVRIDAGTFLNSGRALATGDGLLRVAALGSHFSGGVLSGGTWEAAERGAVRLIGANIQTLAATVVLNGPDSRFYSNDATTDALAGLIAVNVEGGLELLGGRVFTTSGSFTVQGAVIVDAASRLVVTGDPVLVSGHTVIDGALETPTDTVRITFGSLEGTGLIRADVINEVGTVQPGSAALDTLTLEGDYRQQDTAFVCIKVRSAVDYGHLAVTGHARLAGMLRLEPVDGFVPAPGDSFRVMSYGSHDGELRPWLNAWPGLRFHLIHRATHVTAVIYADAASVPGDGEPIPGGDTPGGDLVPAAPEPTKPADVPSELRLAGRPRVGGGWVLSLDLPEAAFVRLDLFDVRGSRVAAIVERDFAAGCHEFSGNGAAFPRRLPTGIFFARAEVWFETRTEQRVARLPLIR